MKTIIALIACLIAALPAGAQQKRWTWKPKDGTATHVLHATAMNESGAAAFVMSELDGELPPSYLIVWLAADGKVMMTKRMATHAERETLLGIKVSGQPWPNAKWSVAFVGEQAVAVTDNKTIRLYVAAKGQPPSVKILDNEDALIFPTQGFAGWLGKDSKVGYLTVGGAGPNGTPLDVPYQNIKGLVAWSVKK